MTFHRIGHVHSARADVYINEYPKYVTMQRSSRTQKFASKPEWVFLLKNIVSEERSWEKSLSSLKSNTATLFC